MSMVKSIVPKEQPFSELASKQFFMLSGQSNRLFQKSIEVDGPNTTPYNTIELVETPVGQRGSVFEFKLVYFTGMQLVSHIEVVKVEVLIRPKSVVV